MINLFETLQQAQNGDAMTAMAKQFGLSQAQAEQAVEALMPAFSTGLKRNAADPAGIGNVLSSLSSGQHAQYFEDMAQAFQPQGVQQGNDVLGQLFGSKDVSRAVARQAEQMTGIGQDIIKQMLPVLAATLMGGLQKQASGQMQQAATGGQGGGLLGAFLEQMTGPQAGAGTSPAAGAQDNPFGRMLEQMMGGGQAAPPDRTAAPDPTQDNPFGQMLEQMMGGMTGGGGPSGAPAGQPAQNPFEELFGQMFETGRQTQETYQKGIEDIFDQYLQGMKQRR